MNQPRGRISGSYVIDGERFYAVICETCCEEVRIHEDGDGKCPCGTTWTVQVVVRGEPAEVEWPAYPQADFTLRPECR